MSGGLIAAAKSGPLTASSLLGAINRGVKEFVERPEAEYVLATSVSVRHFSELDDVEIAGCTLSFGRYLPDFLRDAHETSKERTREYIFGEYPDQSSLLRHYTAVWIDVSARSEHEALSKGLAALDLRRGIWNLALNRRKWERTTNQRRKPVNPVLLGPVHSLHHPDGTLASAFDWYEYDYVEPTQSDELKKHWERVQRDEAGAWRCLDKSQYRAELEEFLRRYTKALDTREWDAAFVQLWGLLEDLTGTKPGESHRVTIKRASFLYRETERDLHYQVLTHLKSYRNSSVHAGEGSSSIEAYLYQLKRYVEQVLEYHLMSGHNFPSTEETARFLDQPADINAIDQKVADLQAKVDKQQAEIERANKAREFHIPVEENSEQE